MQLAHIRNGEQNYKSVCWACCTLPSYGVCHFILLIMLICANLNRHHQQSSHSAANAKRRCGWNCLQQIVVEMRWKKLQIVSELQECIAWSKCAPFDRQTKALCSGSCNAQQKHWPRNGRRNAFALHVACNALTTKPLVVNGKQCIHTHTHTCNILKCCHKI